MSDYIEKNYIKNIDKPVDLILILHGYGANADNLEDLADIFAPDFENAKFILPDAPNRCEMGAGGYQWFSLIDRDLNSMIPAMEAACDKLDEFIDSLLKKYKNINNLHIMGFSQGAMMSIHYALTRERQFTNVVCFSGTILDRKMKIKYIPKNIVVIHGEDDDVVPIEKFDFTSSVLSANKIDFKGCKIPGLGHSIDNKALEFARTSLIT